MGQQAGRSTRLLSAQPGEASTAGFILGGLALGAGAVLLVTAPRASTRRAGGAGGADGIELTPWVGVASAGVRGVF